MRSVTVGSSISAHRLSAVCREPTRIPRARARPSAAYGLKRGYGLTVYSSALPWIFTAYGVSASARARIERAHHEVVGERDVRRDALGHLAHGGDVGVDVAVELGLGEIGERPRVDALVAIGHVQRQQPADVGPVDGRRGPARGGRVTHSAPESQSPDGVDPVQRQRIAVLAEQVDLVAAAHERRRQLRVVDVGAGPGEQVAVEDEDAHGGGLYGASRPDPLLRSRRDGFVSLSSARPVVRP